MPRKRKRRTRREAMASMEEMRDLSRFCRDFQYRVTCKSKLEFATDSYSHLESPEEADAAEHGHSHRWDHVGHGEGHLQDGSEHDKEVKPVEEGDEVEGEAKGVHLEEHLKGEEDDEEKVRRLLELAQPVRLPKVFSCRNLTIKQFEWCPSKSANHGVEKDKGDNNPKHCLRLHSAPAFWLHTSGKAVSTFIRFLAPVEVVELFHELSKASFLKLVFLHLHHLLLTPDHQC